MTTTKKMLLDELTNATNRSMSHNESVSVDVDSIEDAISTLNQMWDGEIDYVENAGETENGAKYTDVWGWDDDTPENEQEWRLYLYVAE